MQKNKLMHKVALVTGAARRIGSEIARTLHAQGMNIVLHYNLSENDAIHLCEQLNLLRENSAIAIRADLVNQEAIAQLVQQAGEYWQRLDVLVNNASRFYRTAIGKITDFCWDDLMHSNLRAPFFLSQAAAPALAAQQGVIINITDIYGERPLKDYSVYCVTKGALLAATKILAKELGPLIRVNAVSPGQIMWPEGENTLSEAEQQSIIDKISLNRAGAAEDIAKAVLYFVKDADYVTGQILSIDGGRLLSG